MICVYDVYMHIVRAHIRTPCGVDRAGWNFPSFKGDDADLRKKKWPKQSHTANMFLQKK